MLSLTGARQDLAGLVVIAPSAGTLRPALIALDADEPDRAAERGCASTPADDVGGRAIALDGKDLSSSWNDDGWLRR